MGMPDVTGNLLVPTPVSTVTSIADLAVGDEHTCIKKPDGTVWCWGYNASGQVGDGTTDSKKQPVKVLSADHVVTSGNSFHTCALTDADGALRCWGANDQGQIGSGSKELSVNVPTAAHILGVTGVTVGMAHTCALTKDGALWCWGANESGQLGPGAKGALSLDPVAVPICP
jgi:hypothetical protein